MPPQNQFLRELGRVYRTDQQRREEEVQNERKRQGLNPTPPVDPLGRRQANPLEVFQAIHQNDQPLEQNPRVHPKTRPDWHIDQDIPNNRAAKRHNGRGNFRKTHRS